MKPLLPEQSAGEIVAIDTLDPATLGKGVALWKTLRGKRRFAVFDDSALELLTPNAILVAVLDADYEYRSVGHNLVDVFNDNFAGRRLSAVIAEMPQVGLGLKMLYDLVRAGGEPIGYHGWAKRSGAASIYHQSAILPFGAGAAVDHILVLTALAPRGTDADRG